MPASLDLKRRAARLMSRRLLAGVACTALAWGVHAQPIPYSELARDTAGRGAAGPRAYASSGSPLGDGLAAAKAGDVNRATLAQAQLTDPIAVKLVAWALIDSAGSRLAFDQLDAARHDLADWPRPARRTAAAEKALDASGASPATVVAWFAGREPETAEGALALATALQAQGQADPARTLVRRWWRERSFEADAQARMQGRFGAFISQDDNVRRLDGLLYGQQGPAARAMLDLVPADARAAAEARMALRAERGDAAALVAALPASAAADPGVAFERARYLRKHGLDVLAVQQIHAAGAPPTPDAATAAWPERRALMQAALKAGDREAAYAAAAKNGLAPQGADYTEAEFFAGWIALTKLHDAAGADVHFANVQRAGQTPVTLSRAFYWRGRAAEAHGDAAGAQTFFRQGGAFTTAFYGQLAAERAGVGRLVLASDPQPTAAERAAFDAREPIKAARLLNAAGEHELFRAFLMAIDDTLTTPGEFVLLVDLARTSGDQDLAMRVARTAGQKGFPLVERGWPLRSAPVGVGLPEAAFTLAITRQESNFDPSLRSNAGARGMMQLMPGTAAILARRQGLAYSADRLADPDYNMRLGAAYLGQLTEQFSGSYVMAAAGYNAGPGRPTLWASDCGDPRQSSIDPADFVECIPFSETRNYVMRVMENVQVYRARLNGGSAPLTLAQDLHRGAWTPTPSTVVAQAAPAAGEATR